MFSPTPPPTDSEDSGILPVSHTNGITDSDISILCRFLFRSTNDKGGLPLKLDVEDTSRLAHAPRHGVAGLNLSRQVLDALVAICVCTSSQRLALSVSLGSKHVQITIAENDTKPSPIIRTHLTSIWEQLGALATLKKRLRRGNNFPDHGTSLRPAGAHLPVSHSEIGALEELKWALERDIHKHCYLKTKQRMTKYLSAYNVFYKFYTRNRKVLDPTAVIADLAFNLSYLYKMVMEYKGLTYLSGIPVELEWDELAMHCRLILHFYTEDEMNVQMKIWGVIDAWRSTEVVKGNHKLLALDLARGIKKMVCLPRHIQKLVNFAYSPRLRSILEKPVAITILSPIAVKLPEPSSSDVSRTVTRVFHSTKFARSHRTDDQELLEDTLVDQLALIPGTLTTTVSSQTVHAEYALLLHHHAEPWSTEHPTPVQYIAVSKRACFYCCAAYKGYRHATGRIFSLHGPHSRLDPACAPATNVFPPDVAERMRAYLYSQVVHLYSKNLVQLEEARNRLGDSSGADDLADLEVVQAARRRRIDEEAQMDAELASKLVAWNI